MRDVHVHFLHGNKKGYTLDYLLGFVETALRMGIKEIYLLEHTHQFLEFERVYEPIRNYNDYQNNWIRDRMNTSIESYLRFIETAKKRTYPVTIKYGLEVCYIPDTADILATILDDYSFDFLTGAVHWIDSWGFDHRDQKELWHSMNVHEVYLRYYEISCELCESNLFTGLAHPDSIKCFGYIPSCDMSETYSNLTALLNEHEMYAENSGGLHLNYSKEIELGLNKELLNVFKQHHVRIYTASDAHKQSDVGANIKELEMML